VRTEARDYCTYPHLLLTYSLGEIISKNQKSFPKKIIYLSPKMHKKTLGEPNPHWCNDIKKMLVYYIGLDIGINIGINTSIKNQTSLVLLKSGIGLILILVGKDLK
jgi:hypothetical protein